MNLGNITPSTTPPVTPSAAPPAKTVETNAAPAQETYAGKATLDNSASLDKQLKTFAQGSAPAKPLSFNYNRDLFGVTTKSGDDILASGLVHIDPAEKNLDELAVKQLANNESYGSGQAALDMGTVMTSPSEVFQVKLGVNLTPNQDGSQYNVSFSPQLAHTVVHGSEETNSVVPLQSFTIQDGTGPNSHGTFTETIPDDPNIPKEDIVSKNDDGVVVKRQFRETWVMGQTKTSDDEQPTYIAERLFEKLDPRGNPVVEKDHFSSTVDPEQLSDQLPAGPDGKKVSPDDLQSGIYIQQGKESSARTLALIGDSDFSDSSPPDSAPTPSGSAPADDKKGGREIVAPIGDRFFSGPTLALGWTKSPTNNPASWYSNRTDFAGTMNEVMADQNIVGMKMDPQVVADLQKRAGDDIKNSDQGPGGGMFG